MFSSGHVQAVRGRRQAADHDEAVLAAPKRAQAGGVSVA